MYDVDLPVAVVWVFLPAYHREKRLNSIVVEIGVKLF